MWMPIDSLNWAYAEKITASIPCMETECVDHQQLWSLALKWESLGCFTLTNTIFCDFFFLAHCPSTAASWLTLVRRRSSLTCAYHSLNVSPVSNVGCLIFKSDAGSWLRVWKRSCCKWNNDIIAVLLEKWAYLFCFSSTHPSSITSLLLNIQS